MEGAMSVREKYRRMKPLPPEALQRVRTLTSLFAKHDIRLVYLFGSAVRGAEGKVSEDLDIAIYPGSRFAFRPFYAELSQALGTDRLDLVDLRHAGVGLAVEVVTHGELLYAAPSEENQLFGRRVQGRFRDFGVRMKTRFPTLKERQPMTLRREWLLQVLHELGKIASELQKYTRITPEQLQAELSLRWTVERGLLAGLTVLFNIADHLLSTVFQEHPETYEALLDALHARGVISSPLRARLLGAGGFRNVLVHEYMVIDFGEVARMAGEAPEIFRSFAEELRQWLQTYTGGEDQG